MNLKNFLPLFTALFVLALITSCSNTQEVPEARSVLQEDDGIVVVERYAYEFDNPKLVERFGKDKPILTVVADGKTQTIQKYEFSKEVWAQTKVTPEEFDQVLRKEMGYHYNHLEMLPKEKYSTQMLESAFYQAYHSCYTFVTHYKGFTRYRTYCWSDSAVQQFADVYVFNDL